MQSSSNSSDISPSTHSAVTGVTPIASTPVGNPGERGDDNRVRFNTSDYMIYVDTMAEEMKTTGKTVNAVFLASHTPQDNIINDQNISTTMVVYHSTSCRKHW